MSFADSQKASREGINRGAGKTSLKVKRKIRHFYDRAARYSIAFGGVSVIATMLLIFLFLLAEVLPLFQSASIIVNSEFQLPETDSAPPLHMALNEQGDSLLSIDRNGKAIFTDINSGASLSEEDLELSAGSSIAAIVADVERSGVFAYSTESGEVFLAEYSWEVIFSGEGEAPITVPRIEYPFGPRALLKFAAGSNHSLAVSVDSGELLLAVSTEAGVLSLFSTAPENTALQGFADSEVIGNVAPVELSVALPLIEQMYIGGDKRLLYGVSEQGLATVFDLQLLVNEAEPVVLAQAQLVPSGARVESLAFMSGGLSLLVGDNRGQVSQWFIVRSQGQAELRSIQSFSVSDTAITDIAVEPRRKNFLALNGSETLSLFNLTSQKRAVSDRVFKQQAMKASISPRGNSIVVGMGEGRFYSFTLNNPHPEVSFAALWRKVWYESYPEPEYVWQSSAASSDFEPKYSLLPLTFGTLKAAFFAMLVATPLAICGAIYTGYFMAPLLRRKVKPLIELMEALPTVVLGFLAGLWLAPLVEVNLLGFLSLTLLLPIAAVSSSFIWSQLPKSIRYRVPEGWEAVLLLPVMVFAVWLCLTLSAPLESVFFQGDLRRWLSDEWGISYAQRNAMIVGVVMGFAVIPTIYSIAEDAIFTVPRHLSNGSLALGATSWQSLYYVVLPTASPGIFSATMIGLGRAVGETMIILMATGNTPIMDFNVFEGMRTLSATIAIEVPESEVSSTHYRILFLAATVLFIFTFIVNTLAEVVRQQLRAKYSNI